MLRLKFPSDAVIQELHYPCQVSAVREVNYYFFVEVSQI